MQLLLSAQTQEEFFTALSGAAINLGFEYCAYGMRVPLPVSNPKMLMLNNYSANWQDRYAQENYLALDPTVAHGMKSVMPIVWSEQIFLSSRPFWEDARAHGLRVGWAQSSYDAHGVGGMLTLSRSNDTLAVSELQHNSLKMTWLVQVAHAGLSKLMSSKRLAAPTISLTDREVEVLRWSADGKTSGEVSDIMSISERTVNFHINNALEKLGAANKTAAVCKAVMLRLL